MNDELEQSNENQDQLEQSNGNQDQLIEIYKLQSQLANSISNRRITIHKFYLLIMSGLALIFPAIFKLPEEIQDLVSIEFLMIGIASLGIPLSVTWFILINSNLRLSMLKYEALKKLEDKLEYQFFKEEWKFLENYGKGKTYWEISYVEIFIPILFFLIFTFLLNAVYTTYPDKFYFQLLRSCPSIIIGYFCATVLGSWQIDKDIRGVKRWTKRKMNWISFAIMLVFALIFYFFSVVYHDAVNKEAETINKKSAETSSEKPAGPDSEKSTKEQIIRPDGKEQKESESVDEQPTGATSEEAVKEQPISPDGKAQNESQ